MLDTAPLTRGLFEPLSFAGLTLKNRLMMAPMGTCLDRGGFITDETIAYYRRRAQGGVGTITVEGCLVSSDTVGPEPGIHGPQFLPGLRRLVEALSEFDVTVGVQLMHPGRQVLDGPRVAPSPIALNSASPVPHELAVAEIAGIVDDYARAAALAREAGFAFVEVHGAHGYLPSDFLSPLSNRREDEYGGDLQRRARFATEVATAIHSAAGQDYPLVWRLNGDDGAPGGLVLDEAVEVARILQTAGVAALSVSGGTWRTLHLTLAPMHEPRGQLIPLAATIKRAVEVPVIAVGRLDDQRLAERVIAEGHADLIALGRGLIAEPDWPRKIEDGDAESRLRPCIACNACVDLVGRGERARCSVNPEVGREREWRISPASPPRRVMVVGSGPAGLESACIARQRGHHVSLWERDSQLGGKLAIAGTAPSKREVLRFRDYQVQRVKDLEIDVHLGVEVDLEHVVAEAPDAVILAHGADPLVPPIAGIGASHVHDAQDLLRGAATLPADDRVVIVGGSATGCEAAEALIGHVRAVTIVEMGTSIGRGLEAITRRQMLRTLRSDGVEILVSCKVLRIEPEGVVYEDDRGDQTLLVADRVGLAIGWTPRRDPLGGHLPGVEVLVIGDARQPADFVAAVNAGADAGLQV
jgi:2,4-dienoyl-CoA reductase-like NADH-dependent reductase (Old Yellow Enzyme family)/thioredoxin reductase